MRPVLLELEGFAAYRNRAAVDFRDTDFFVLVGSTGSGKSTIIDAMVFALYGTVPRWGERNAVAPALAPTVNRGMVRLIFDAGGSRYVAARDIRRRGGGVGVSEARLERFADSDADGTADDVTTPLATGREVSPAVADLLGLTFEQFTKSVALPQGEFAEFLHATPADRQDILKSLLGYRIYDQIQGAARSQSANEASRANMLAEQLKDYADATPEAVAAASTEVEDLLALQKHVTEVSVVALRTSLEQARDARARVDKLSRERELLSGLQMPSNVEELDAEKAIRAEAVTLARTEMGRLEALDAAARAAVQQATPRHVLERVIADWRTLAKLDTQLPELKALADAAESALTAANAARTTADAAVEAARTAALEANKVAEERERELAQVEAHVTALASLQVPAGIDALGQHLRDADDELAQANSGLGAAETSQRAAISALDAAPDTAVLANAASAADELRAALSEDLTGAEDRAHVAAKAAKARKKSEASAELVAAAEKSVREAEHADQAVALRAELTVGDDCPVCGRVVKSLPSAQGVGALQDARQRLKTVRAEHAEAESRAARLEAAAARDMALREARLAQCEAARDRLVAGVAALDVIDELGVLASATDVDTDSPALKSAHAAAESVLAAIREAQRSRSEDEQRRRDADAAVDAARAEVREAEAAVASIRQEAGRARAELSAARDAVGSLGPPKVDDGDVEAAWTQLMAWARLCSDELGSKQAALASAADDARAAATESDGRLASASTDATEARNAVVEATATKTQVYTRLDTAETQRTTLTQTLAEAPALDDAQKQLTEVIALQDRVDELGRDLAAVRTAVEDAESALKENEAATSASWHELRTLRDPLAQFGAPPVGDTTLGNAWRQMVDWAQAEATARSAKTDAERAVARDADERVAAARAGLIAELAARDVTVDADLPADELLSNAPVAVAAAVATAQAGLSRMHERRETSATMRTQMEQALEAGTVARELARLMRADQFPQWLIASALDTLLLDASTILMEVSGGQFELRREQGDLVVLDHNDADMSRPVKTLSGGETFQASLALALALSAQVTALSAAGAKKLESIFLDEGFGTLDETTLDVVASTLENLASSGSRMVGVITHVAALAERIPVRFQVYRDALGSHIEREQV